MTDMTSYELKKWLKNPKGIYEPYVPIPSSIVDDIEEGINRMLREKREKEGEYELFEPSPEKPTPKVKTTKKQRQQIDRVLANVKLGRAKRVK